MNTQEAIKIIEKFNLFISVIITDMDPQLKEAITHAIEHMKRVNSNFDKYFSCPKDTIQIQVCRFDGDENFQVRALSYSKGWANCMEISSNTENIGSSNECLYKAAPEPQERKD